MSFVSPEFGLLLLALLSLFCLFRSTGSRKIVLLAASCFFYAYWDWRFLGLLGVVTLLDYSISRLMLRSTSHRARKGMLAVSVFANLGFLAIFKYFNFFLGSLNVLLGSTGWHWNTLNIILPIALFSLKFSANSELGVIENAAEISLF